MPNHASGYCGITGGVVRCPCLLKLSEEVPVDQIFHHFSSNVFFLHCGTTTLNLSSVLTKPQEHFPEDQIRGTRGGQSENASHTPPMSSCSQESFVKSRSHVSQCRVHLQKQRLCGAARRGCGFMTAVTCYTLCTTRPDRGWENIF